MGSEASTLEIGAAVRRHRAAAGLSLSALASVVDVSKAHLSRIESGERSPSIAVLSRLASEFGVGLAALIPGTDDNEEVVRSEGPIVRSGDLLVKRLTNRESAQLQPLRVTVPLGRAWSPRVSHPGEEWIYVLNGCVKVEHGGAIDELGPGDAIHFVASEPHRLIAVATADILIVTSKGKVSHVS